MEKPWFESWFASPYYHILYKERDIKEAQYFLDRLIDFLKPAPASKILDVACGKGRHSVYLNEKGFEVTGFDLSKESIEYDKQFQNPTLSFFVHDMRKPFRADYFDLVFNLFSSFGYFEDDVDNEKVIASQAQALKKGGTLVLDYMNAEKICSCLVPQEEKNIEGIRFHVKKRIKNHKIVKQISFSDKGKDYNFEEVLGIFTLNDFKKLFAANGLVISHIFGDYALNAFDRRTSDRLLIVSDKS
jgi:SAM-dependent methyltransferase